MNEQLYCLSEEIKDRDYITASYYMKLPKEQNIIKRAESLAIGQTIGTWLPVPGITDEIREKHMGKVVRIFDVPAVDLSTQVTEADREYIIQIAYPTVNLTPDFPLMTTSLLGNDASTSAQVKLLDIEMPRQFISEFNGPNHGIEGIRKFTGVADRPLLLNMIKPCTGLSPLEGARIFYDTALGNVDLIKDDELLGSPSYSLAWERVREFKRAAKSAYEVTGREVKYLVNVTDGSMTIMDTVKRVLDAGADAIMVNFAAVGYSVLHQIAKSVSVPILAHCASAGVYTEGVNSGMSTPLAVGKLARMAGADMVMINTPYGGYPMLYQKYMQTMWQLALPLYDMKKSMPVIGGGVHPGMVETYIKEAGTDIILAAGGAVQGHPMGAARGADAMRYAIDAVMEGISLTDAAKDHEELKTALDLWGYHKAE